VFISGIDTDKFSEYIEDCICRQEPLLKVLRLVCLQSLCNGGLKQRVLDQYRTEILQVCAGRINALGPYDACMLLQ
jgi:hypothetical protein